MTGLISAVYRILQVQIASGKPLAIIVAGHNGSGKSTMWNEVLAPRIQIPLVNADRMMMSILPEPQQGRLSQWAADLRDRDPGWMRVAQKGVEAFVIQAMAHQVPFAMETVFSHWQAMPDGTISSKIDRMTEMQKAGYFVLLLFVGLSNSLLSTARVQTRIAQGGHAVEHVKLTERFPRTQQAIKAAIPIADAAILMDNSRARDRAFTVCRIQVRTDIVFDLRDDGVTLPIEIGDWLNIISPQQPRA
jgi:predicted ABC-type ATPase